ncbi:MAG TPA: SRPBCC domain-containing protein [Longimicrobium sp.]|nr:SRPBCC domain-containing protein [Longimicrobium sp.]
MSTQEQPLVVRVTRRYGASAERVFDAFLDPAKAGRFMFATPTGEMVRVEIDARVGGRYAFVDRRDGDDVEHTGEYLEIDRPRRLVFTFSADGSEPDRVAIDVAPLESGGCEVTLAHEMNPKWAEYADRATEGWRGILDGLAEVVGE